MMNEQIFSNDQCNPVMLVSGSWKSKAATILIVDDYTFPLQDFAPARMQYEGLEEGEEEEDDDNENDENDQSSQLYNGSLTIAVNNSAIYKHDKNYVYGNATNEDVKSMNECELISKSKYHHVSNINRTLKRRYKKCSNVYNNLKGYIRNHDKKLS
ncbi:uncharacterized protein J8A68_004817 [[Candida] subhashii]|uniref:Uncharacterized protein n=1 Tax=[Candida] subhashii TaxID=561895 RepID=A0A8J5Q507_9ASCO|nr:uncharacterized protein J8A68_004817 [[Candida] subhashii]KAG7661664.1 hypothetical protein J8A68_004817 [[Candida] subhashii]